MFSPSCNFFDIAESRPQIVRLLKNARLLRFPHPSPFNVL